MLHLSDMKFPSRSSSADDEMFGEEEALPLAFLLQRQRSQPPSGDLPLLTHRHLDQGSCEKNDPISLLIVKILSPLWSFSLSFTWLVCYVYEVSFTLSDKCLAGVQQHLAALHDHALDSQILPDVLRLAHFIVHDSERTAKLQELENVSGSMFLWTVLLDFSTFRSQFKTMKLDLTNMLLDLNQCRILIYKINIRFVF